MRYISHFTTVVVTTHIAILFFFGMLWYFTDLEQAINNVGGWYEVYDNGVVHFHAFNLLHYMGITYIPAIILAPFGCFIDWVNRPKKIHRTATGKPLKDIKL